MNEWDGTPWAGSAVKAETGPFVANMAYGTYLSALSRSPQKLMREAQALYHSNPWIRTAEAVVTRKVVGLPWHLEDAEDEEIADDVGGEVGAIRALLEKPQAALASEMRQEAVITRRGLWAITSRHIGLCGMAYWYLDQVDGAGTPLAILYVNPARVWPATDEQGHIVGWLLDAKSADGRGGTPVERDQLIPFYLDPPDQGAYGSGLVEAAWQKAQITMLADRHAAYILGTGGRLAGIVAPKEGSIGEDQYKALVNEFRVVNEAPDAAKRTTILRGPIDFTQTAADPAELALLDLSKMNRDDILAVWGVPPSQAAIPSGGGLNSGETRKYDEAVLMQGAVHDRVVSMRETIQYRFLDRYQARGIVVELEIDEPEFDDRTPAFDLAAKSLNIPLTNTERRALIGLDPTGNEAFDDDVVLPVTLVSYDAGAELEPAAPFVPFGKATMRQKRFLGLRASVETRFVPALRKTLAGTLREQARAIAAVIREKGAHLARKPKDTIWWNEKREDERLAKVLRPAAAGIAEVVTKRTADLLSTGKAEGFEERVLQRITTATGARIKGINATTRDAVQVAVEQGFADGLSPGQVADLIEGLPAFDVTRAELVARTESMFAYNDAALGSYGEFGVTEVEAVDGDKDEECAARVANNPYTLEEAAGIEDHPNGTLDWIPIVGRAYLDEPLKAAPTEIDALKAMFRSMAEPPIVNLPAPVVNIEAQPAPIINVAAPAPSPAPVVNVPAAAAPIVNIDMTPVAAMIAELKQAFLAPRAPLVKTVIRGKDGRIEQVVEA
jgi:phage portal protein BeeE